MIIVAGAADMTEDAVSNDDEDEDDDAGGTEVCGGDKAIGVGDVDGDDDWGDGGVLESVLRSSVAILILNNVSPEKKNVMFLFAQNTGCTFSTAM